MIFSPPPSRSRTTGPTAATGSAPAVALIASSPRITCSLAPPCSGPFSVPSAATTAECMSDRVAAHTRAANVDAFIVWSACSTRQVSRISASRAAAAVPRSWSRKLAARLRPGSAGTQSRPSRAAW